MNLNTLNIFNSGNPHDRFDIICMMFDDIFEKNKEIIDKENVKLHILTDIHDVTYGDKDNYIPRIPRGMTKSLGGVKFVEINIDEEEG